MAPVSRPPGRRAPPAPAGTADADGAGGARRRGQLILVGGLILAATLVSLTLILNSGIYTLNLATRAGSPADTALALQHGAEAGVGGLVESAIDDHPDDLALQRTNVTEGVPAIRERVGRITAHHSTYTNVTYLGETNGTRIRQDADRNFTNASGTSDWELVANAGGVRRFRLDVTRTDLVETTITSVGSSDAFRVRFIDGNGNEWLVYVYNESSETKVVTENVASGTKFGPCSDASGTRTTINVTAGTVAGDRCPALEIFERLSGDLEPTSGLTIRYNSTEPGGTRTVVGTYELTVDASTSTVSDGDFQPGPAGDYPVTRAAIYAVEVEFVYETSDLTYEASMTVAPGEPDD